MSLFLALEHGTDFAAVAAVGSIASVIAQAAFALAYARSARRGAMAAFALAALSFVVVAAASRAIALGALPLAIAACAALAVVTRLMPARSPNAPSPRTPAWDLPARMIVATVLVLALTGAAPLLGPFSSGLLSGFPLYATVLGIFAHRAIGPGAAGEVMRGLSVGLFAFTIFFLVLATALVPLGIAYAFGLAIVAIVAVQAVSFAVLRRSN